MSTVINLLRAESYKLKSSPVPYLAVVACLFVGLIMFLGHFLDVHHMCKLDTNPWDRHFRSSRAIFMIFVACPLSILLVTGFMYIEQRADAWKYLYTTPFGRGAFYVSKLVMILLLFIITLLLLIIVLFAIGYLLNFFYPEYEYSYYSPEWSFWFSTMLHLLIAVLGIISFQYFLCYQIKNFLIPLGIGIAGYIAGFILAATDHAISLFFPYVYPMVAQDVGMFRNEQRKALWEGSWMNNVELCSIICFFIFLFLGLVLEVRKDIK